MQMNKMTGEQMLKKKKQFLADMVKSKMGNMKEQAFQEKIGKRQIEFEETYLDVTFMDFNLIQTQIKEKTDEANEIEQRLIENEKKRNPKVEIDDELAGAAQIEQPEASETLFNQS